MIRMFIKREISAVWVPSMGRPANPGAYRLAVKAKVTRRARVKWPRVSSTDNS